MQTPKIGDTVIFVDPTRRERPALLTAVWGEVKSVTQLGENGEHVEVVSYPSVNLVTVSDDESRNDTYGRQIQRETSVVHESNQYAPGNYWKLA